MTYRNGYSNRRRRKDEISNIRDDDSSVSNDGSTVVNEGSIVIDDDRIVNDTHGHSTPITARPVARGV